MKIQRKDRTKLILIISSIIAVAIGSSAVFSYVNDKSDQINIDKRSGKDKLPAPKTQEDKEDSEKVNPNEQTSTPDIPGKPTQSVPVPSEEISDAKVNITNLSQDKNNININASVDSASSGGQCIVYFTSQNGDSISSYLDIKDENDSISCKGSLPSLNFSYIGSWTARVVYINDNKKVEGTSTIEVK